MTQRLGEYELVQELGRGAMGSVHRARHETLGREVAIKVLLRQDARGLARFANEAQAVARLQHPHIVKLHEAALDAPEPYLVLSYVPGGSLAERLRRGPLPEEDALALGLQLADALAHAHDHGVLHRDLKPENVLLDARAPRLRAQLTDFGLAKGLATTRERLTRTGELIGTPAYMAPEQIAARAEAIGPETDVYGLGAVLYAALAGRPPFESENLIGLAAAIVQTPPPPLLSLRPELSPQLAAIVERCLAKDPADRFPSAAALKAALERPTQEVSRWPRLAPKLLALAGLTAIGLTAIGLAAGSLRTPRAEPPPATPPLGSEAPAAPGPETQEPEPWSLRPGQVLGYHLTRWLQREDPKLLASLGLLLQLEVQRVEPAEIHLQATLVRIRYWIDGPRHLRFDSNFPRSRLQGLLTAALNRPFQVVLDPRRAKPPRFDGVRRALRAPLRDPRAPSQQQPFDAGWVVERLAETLDAESLTRFFSAPQATFSAGALERTHRRRTADGGVEVERLERVDLCRVEKGQDLRQVCHGRALALGWVLARNRIPSPNKIRVGDVLELPRSRQPTRSARVVRLDSRGDLRIHARPWGVVLSEASGAWRFAAVGEQGPWTQIQWGGGTAWVRTSETVPDSSPAFAVTAKALWVRDTPRAEPGNQIGQLVEDQVYVGQGFSPRRGWTAIRLDDRIGYVASRYLRPVRSP